MTGRARLAVCAGVATLTSACAMLPLTAGATWLLQACVLLGLQTVAGVVARRVPLARPLTVLVQLALTLMLLTLIFAHDQAVGWVLPGPDAFAQFGGLFTEGAQDVRRYSIPAPVSDGIRMILLAGVAGIGLLVDALAVTYRSAAPAGLPLLALYSVAAGLYDGGANWLWFLVAAAGFLLLLLAEGRERLSQWGRVFGRLPGPSGRPYEPGSVGGSPVAAVRTGRRIGALTLGIALAVPAALPSLDSGLLDSLGGPGSGLGPGNGTVTAVDPLVALQDSLNQPENRTVLTYRTDNPDPGDMYLRIVSLDRFDGAAWEASERRITRVPESFPAPPGLSEEVKTRRVTTTVSAADWYAQSWLPMPYPATGVDVEGGWRFEPRSLALVGEDGQTTRGARYRVESLLVQPTTQQLAQAGEPSDPLPATYTEVPNSLPDVVERTARQVTRNADNDYERAVQLQEWFTLDGGFTYDTEVRAGSGTAAIARFLKQREGFCVHFAFSMAAMSRTLGIPARVAVGFTPGEELDDGRMAVGLQDAHAWPELYFDGVGWVRFEPTPTRGSSPAYSLPEIDGSGGDRDSLVPERPDDTAEPAPAPSESAECTAAEKRLDPTCGGPEAAGGAGGGGDGGVPWGTVVPVSGALVALLLLPMLPMLWRLRARRRRLAGGEVLAAWREMLDSGWDLGIEPDEAATPRRAAERLVERGALGTEAAAGAERVAHAVERLLYAPVEPEADGLAGDVRRVRAELVQRAPRGRRARALLWPRSALRVIWVAADRRTEWNRRWRGMLRPGTAGR
ncbi:DUF3488 and transglutaminase-like domain-containing protein [Streptomyces sp. DSM 42041]|uniref:DUF3488 and transglutaminase-like domain-containing protein n=1 Tax=Streptomyces hazeniae TaxID=3075538 RepID=A0ABU2NVP4_9ACTN|nr:DUF3488 and transglutaminase-like domain-containing protein [Streptomyces sp. DSM 42041]MDT0381057.1 DUF3488 and transglutaminase-like domain-containing protein [Streptomyces sp. DSM 42041]